MKKTVILNGPAYKASVDFGRDSEPIEGSMQVTNGCNWVSIAIPR